MARHVPFVTVPVLLGVFLLATGCSKIIPRFDRSATAPVPTSQASVKEGAREIPVTYDVDVVVVGGSSGAVRYRSLQ